MQRLHSALLRKGFYAAPDDVFDCTVLAASRSKSLSDPVTKRLPFGILQIQNNPGFDETDLAYFADCWSEAAACPE